MAYDSTNKKLYVAEGSGIAPWEVAQCLSDYRVNSRGQRDVGMLCTSPNINYYNKFKPTCIESYDFQTEDDFKAANYGRTWSESEYTHDEHLLISTCGYLAPTGDGWPKRLGDFDGYCHGALDGLALTTKSAGYTPNDLGIGNQILLKTNEDQGYNITFKDLEAVIGSRGIVGFSNMDEYGFEYRCNTGVVVWRIAVGDYDAMLSRLYSEDGVNYPYALANHPKGEGGFVYVYGYSSSKDLRLSLSPLVPITDNRTDDKLGKVNYFSPNMQVGTYLSGFNTQRYWSSHSLRVGGTAESGSKTDRLMFAFQIARYRATTTIAQMSIFGALTVRMLVTIGDDVYTVPVGYNSSAYSDGNWSIAGSATLIGTLGLASYDAPASTGANCFWLPSEFFKEKLTYATDTEVTFQLVYGLQAVSDGTFNILNYLSSPVTMTINYAGTAIATNPMFPEIDYDTVPDWDIPFEQQQ